ncbi:hypothetical protein AB0F77_39780 [Streptomyces sp. NPDC026672]|uniref:hypothetical protein n=1 Tax=Actinomycetes TaxID=1760 RepID=UPI003411A569
MTTELNITARGILRGDVFELHGHTRQASKDAWPTRDGNVHVPFAGGGDAFIPENRPVTVSRTVPEPS